MAKFILCNGIAVVVLCAVVAFGQPAGGGPVVRDHAPTDRALDFSLAALQAEYANMKANELITVRLLEGGAFSFNARYLTNAGTAQVHDDIVEFWMVQEGSATVVTGGSLVDVTEAAGQVIDEEKRFVVAWSTLSRRETSSSSLLAYLTASRPPSQLLI